MNTATNIRPLTPEQRAEQLDDVASAIARRGRSLLLIAHPGAGATAIARRVPKYMLPVADDTLLESAWLWAGAGAHGAADLLASGDCRRPTFRAPHHTASTAALVGTSVRTRRGLTFRPGEVSLAHGGVLLLDEVSEFPALAVESLGIALRKGRSTLYREPAGFVHLPARPGIVIARANPCPCGWYGSAERECRCNVVDYFYHQRRVTAAADLLGIETWDVRNGWDSLLQAAEVQS